MVQDLVERRLGRGPADLGPRPRPEPARDGGAEPDAAVEKTLTTGAEPWNVVISPDGKRVFVANSAQDTITVIDAAARTIVGQVDLRDSLCHNPDRARHFQPRGLAVTQGNDHLYVTPGFTHERGRR